MFEKFTEGAVKIIMLSQEEARRLNHNFVGTEHLLLGVIGQKHGIGAKSLKKFKISLGRIRKEIELYLGRGTGFVASEIPFTPRAKRVLEMAILEGKDLGQNFVGTEHLLLALTAEHDGLAMRTLERLNVDIYRLRSVILFYIEETYEDLFRPLSQTEKYLLERERRGPIGPTLEEYAENITKEALDGFLDPVIGREKEIENLSAVLARRTKNNPVLVGEPGVGKTAVAEGLAQIIVAENGHDFLKGSVIMALDLGSILAGTKYRGEFEERLKRIVEETQINPSIILVIDEIHTLVGAGAAEGAVDAANILKPALARGGFRCIGATTSEEYRKYIERDAALERRFQPVEVQEPSVGITIRILRGLRSKFEFHHGLSYNDQALEQAAITANKYIADRYLPDKAIDVIDEAGARVRLENRKLPFGLKGLLKELQLTLRDKENALKKNDFPLAKDLLEHEVEVRTHIRIMKHAFKEKEKQEKEKQEKEKQREIENKKRLLNGKKLEKIESLVFIEKAEYKENEEKTIDRENLEKVNNMREDVDLVNENDIARVVSNWTGIPITKITDSESNRLLKMEDTIHKRIIGQKHAVSAVSKAIRRGRVGLRNPNRPIASFIFAGPTGVGKTELTKALSDYMFASEESMIRLDMSEYMEKHTVSKLIGSPPGYVGYHEGGQLTEAVRSKPYSVILLDEVEKAHEDVFNLLLQILDDGRLTDSKGRVVSFNNTLLIMTSNLGSKVIEEESGLKPRSQQEKERDLLNLATKATGIVDQWAPPREPVKEPEVFERLQSLVLEELKVFFRPEFLNRIDEIIVFEHLTKNDIWNICGLMIDQIRKRVKEKGIYLIVDESAKSFLTTQGYEPIYGARPLRRAIITYIEDAIAEQCLLQELPPGSKMYFSLKKQGLNYQSDLEVRVDFNDADASFLQSTNKKVKNSLNVVEQNKLPMLV